MTSKNVFYDLPSISTKRLLLRKLTMDDAQDVFEYGADPEVSKYVSWPTHRTLEDSREFLHWATEQYHYGEPASWGIVYKPHKKLIGTIGFVYWNAGHARAEIGYALSQKYWNQGLVTEAARAVIEFGFDQMGLHRIEARCKPENIGSSRVMEKCGMTFEGILRDQMYVKGEFHDLKMYSILGERDGRN